MMPSGRIPESSIANELKCEKVVIQGLDKASRPVMIVQVCKHNGWTRYIDELERLCCYALDALISRAPEDKNPGAQCSVVLDLTNMGALSMDIQAIKKLLQLLGEHYVERLGVMYFFNPPSLFWGVWTSLSPLLPEPTRAKMKIIDPASDSHDLIQDIPREVLPREFGGLASMAPPLGRQ
ncbi:CRAL-TRIO domain-containing protein [Dunaliella salina]|uniref:CRAL-TRIO domain-containing protein n=1 Tax=Dunaliella salina TaxID=3046 RepID=A0ABQ7GQ33_DUNSA|nr:CRAL-TRIO domain-containing protein [Dunaliella salina]|eukprot:KAF5836715.1 CRAL-TRIO domain-containing protein [Dunaliella salina]